MKTAVYDNPKTHCREVWADGRLMSFVSERDVLAQQVNFQAPELTELAKKYGQWNPGAVHGDAMAIAERHRVAPSNPGSSGDAPQTPTQ